MKNTLKTIFFVGLVAAMILPFIMIDTAEATCRDCGNENQLRVWADYGNVTWYGLHHHISNNLGVNVSVGQSGSNDVTASQRDSGFIYPSFVVKSNSLTSKTASYTISYTMVDPNLGTISTDSKRYNNVVFSNYLDGESENFPALRNGINPGTIHTVTIQVHSIS